MNNQTTNETNPLSGDSNEQAWNNLAYEAWHHKFGTPFEAARKISSNPEKFLSILYDKIPQIKESKIANLMGSNATKAVALALLGADVTVIDFSKGNQRYALELAASAGVHIRYLLENVIALPDSELTCDYDVVFAEIGILHYFTDLAPLFHTVLNLLKPGGTFVLRDFHPVSNKLITSRGTTAKIRKHKVTGDYFDTSLVESQISFAKYIPQAQTQTVFLRKWTLGEIITSLAQSGLIITSLDEEPNLSCPQYDKGIPKTFTLTAKK